MALAAAVADLAKAEVTDRSAEAAGREHLLAAAAVAEEEMAVARSAVAAMEARGMVAGAVAGAAATGAGASAAVGEVVVVMEVVMAVAMEEALAVVKAGPTAAKGTAEG
jgi:hypothetical protein